MGNSSSRNNSLTNEFSESNISRPRMLVTGAEESGGPHSQDAGALRRASSARLPGAYPATQTSGDRHNHNNPFRQPGRPSQRATSTSSRGAAHTGNLLSPIVTSNSLSVPTGTHRRSRSADAIAHNRNSGAHPPPPYSPSADPPRNAAVALGSQQTQVNTLSPTAMSPQAGNAAPPDRPLVRRNSVENALETLRKYSTVFIIDDSSSMDGPLWIEARDALASLAHIANQYDADGIDVCFLNDRRVGLNMRNAVSVQRLFDSVTPFGATPIAERLETLLLEYLDRLERAKERYDAGDRRAMENIKAANYIIITDGAPTDDPESVIVTAARRLDSKHFPLTQVGIQFVQIGSSRAATAFLKELDDGLAVHHTVRDIVDTTPYTGGRLTAENLTKILLGGINRRVDRKGGLSVLV